MPSSIILRSYLNNEVCRFICRLWRPLIGISECRISIVAAYDNWKPATDVYKNNFDHPIHELNLTDGEREIEEIQKHNPDIIIGGPPCQDFSSAGKRDTSLGRARN